MASYYDAYDDGAEDVLKNTEEILKLPAVQALIEKEKAAAVAAKMATVDVIGDPARTSIGEYNFANNNGLIVASFPAATIIGNNAFEGCSNLTTANFPMVTSIGGSAFNSCSKLTTVNFPVATSIGDNAFNSCSNLTTANLPAVTSIGGGAFSGCTSLTDLTLSSMTVAEVTIRASTWEVPSGCVVHCKDGDYTVP